MRKIVPGAGEKGQSKNRRILTFEPCGPVSAMLESELKKLASEKERRPRGALRRVIQLCIVNALGPKYPKLMERYKTLAEEDAA